MSLKGNIYYAKVRISAILRNLMPRLIVKKEGSKSVYISYLTEPFKKTGNIKYFNAHQNRRESLVIAEVLDELDFSYVIQDFDAKIKPGKSKFDYIFGLEPNFVNMSLKNQNAKKIYYATGSYFEHQNKVIIERTDSLSKKYLVDYPYYRLVNEHESCEIADYILQIGSKFTLETYPAHLRKKVILLNQSSHVFSDFDLKMKIDNVSRTDYIWMGGGGSVLKGLDLVLEYFIEHSSLKLHIVGIVEEEMLNIYARKLKNANNIAFYGFMDVESSRFRNIANVCAFQVYPSSSEGGAPGSVLNLQKLGVIPILSKWASFNEIDELGYRMKSIDAEGLYEGMAWSQAIDNDKFSSLIAENHLHACKTNTLENFKNEFKQALKNIVNHK